MKINRSRNTLRQPGVKKAVRKRSVLRKIPVIIFSMQEETITIRFSEPARGGFTAVRWTDGYRNPRI